MKSNKMEISYGWEVLWFLIKSRNLPTIHCKCAQLSNFLKVWGPKILIELKLELMLELKCESNAQSSPVQSKSSPSSVQVQFKIVQRSAS